MYKRQVVAKYCDGAIIVIGQGMASARMIQSVKKQLEASGVRILGAVLNKVDVYKRQTLNRSSLANAMRGAHVNLERAMAADGRFGGHIVSGHVDGTGRIRCV